MTKEIIRMPDEKLTDEEIIKRLERCVKRGNRNYDTDIVFDLINRQKAEIERLKGSTIVNNIMEGQRIKREAKAEAYKEFAERLKNKIKTECNPYGAPTFDYDTSIKILNFIDNLVKEMVGEEE